MSKIVSFIKEKYKVFIPILVILVLLLTSLFFLKMYKYNMYRDKSEVKVYKEILGSRVDFTANLYTNKKNILMELEAVGKSIVFDSNPVYYQDEAKVLFPSEMSIIFPFENNIEYLVGKNSIYEKVGNLYYLNNMGYNKDYLYFFMYDGDDLYFFVDDVTIKINESDYTTISGMSYVSLVGTSLIYYDYANGVSEVLELDSTDSVVVYNDLITLDLKSDKLGSNKLLRKKIEGLTPLKDKDDK